MLASLVRKQTNIDSRPGAGGLDVADAKRDSRFLQLYRLKIACFRKLIISLQK